MSCGRNVVHHNYLFSKGVVKVTEDPGFWKDAPDQLGALKKIQTASSSIAEDCTERFASKQTSLDVFFVHFNI